MDQPKSHRRRVIDGLFARLEKQNKSAYYNNGELLPENNPTFQRDYRLLVELKETLITVDYLGGLDRIRKLVKPVLKEDNSNARIGETDLFAEN